MAEFTQKQHEDALRIVDKFRTLGYRKYQLGAEEHGGNLWDKDPRQLAREVQSEAIDQFMYIFHLIGWVDKLVDKITQLEAENKKLREANDL